MSWIPRSKLSACLLTARAFIPRQLPRIANMLNPSKGLLRRLLLQHLSNAYKQRRTCVASGSSFVLAPVAGDGVNADEKKRGHLLATSDQQKQSRGLVQPRRNYSSQWEERDDGDDGRPPYRTPLKLMEFKEVLWPSLWKSFRNKWFALLIRNYYDDTFSIDGFIEATTQAVAHVSSQISEGNFSSLHGLVEEDALREVQMHYADLDVSQRRFIAVNPADLFFKFVYEIGMMFDDYSDQRFVEITVVLQGFHGFEEAKNQDPANYYREVKENQDKLYVCNYRLIRDYTKGVESDWIINKLNHFKPKEFTLR